MTRKEKSGPSGAGPSLSEGGERSGREQPCRMRRQRRRPQRRQRRPAPARNRAGHRHLRLRKIGRAACVRRRRLLLRRQPAARAAARLPAPRDAAPRPAHRHRRRRAQRRLAAAPAAAARAAARRRHRRAARSSSTRRPHALVRRFSETRRAHPLARPRRARRGDRARAPAARRAARALDRDRHQPAAADAAARLDARAGRRRRQPPHARLRELRLPSTACRSTPTTCSTSASCRTRTTFASCARSPAATPPSARTSNRSPRWSTCWRRSRRFLRRWLPAFEADQRSYLTVAIGCTGGQHRSVWFAERLARCVRRDRRRRSCAIASSTPLSRPEAARTAMAELPLFPLRTVLFPDGLLELKIFEARYLDLMSRCLRERAPFGVVALARGQRGAQRRGRAGAALRSRHARRADRRRQRRRPASCSFAAAARERFDVGATRQERDGLWLARHDAGRRPTGLAAPTASQAHVVKSLADAIATLAAQGAEPFLEPHRFDDAGWVANRWCEILPLPLEAKQRLMTLDGSRRAPRGRRFADEGPAREALTPRHRSHAARQSRPRSGDGGRLHCSRLRSGAGRPSASAASWREPAPAGPGGEQRASADAGVAAGRSSAPAAGASRSASARGRTAIEHARLTQANPPCVAASASTESSSGRLQSPAQTPARPRARPARRRRASAARARRSRAGRARGGAT